jgi:hypothetical protein
MGKSRGVLCTLVAWAVMAGYLISAAPCGAAGTPRQPGALAVTLGVTLNALEVSARAGLEYRSPAGFGAKVAIGTIVSSLIADIAGGMPLTPLVSAEALAILPICRVGRAGALELAPGMPTLIVGVPPRWPAGVLCSAGGALRLRFDLGSRWSFSVRAGGGYFFLLDASGFHSGTDTDLRSAFWPDLQVGAGFTL